MKDRTSPIYIASIVVLRCPLRYVVSTNAGVAVYKNFDSLPTFCKKFLQFHLNQALTLDDVTLVGQMEVDVHD